MTAVSLLLVLLVLRVKRKEAHARDRRAPLKGSKSGKRFIFCTTTTQHHCKAPQRNLGQMSLLFTRSPLSPLASTSRLLLPRTGAAVAAVTARVPSAHHLHTSPRRSAAHFDTHAIVARLEASGVPREQADVLVRALADAVDESVKGLERGLIPREEAERWRYSQKVSSGTEQGRESV